MDAQTGETLYEYNADIARVPASMTKVLTAYIIYQELEAGRLTLDTQSRSATTRLSNPATPAIPPPYR